MKKIRVGVIGAGAMGKHHPRIYSEMKEVELVGVADVDERRAAEVAAEYNTEAFTDCEHLLRNDLDAVSIAVPTSLHKEVALTPHKIRKLTVTGTGGVAHADYVEQSLEIWKEEGVREVEIEKREPLKNELEHFMHAITNDEEPGPSGEETFF